MESGTRREPARAARRRLAAREPSAAYDTPAPPARRAAPLEDLVRGESRLASAPTIGKWLEENCPPSMRKPLGPDEDDSTGAAADKVYKNPEEKLWLDRMAARGWTRPTWPKEYGGGGLSNAEARVLAEEMRRIRAARRSSASASPCSARCCCEYGNEEQKHEHLPKIVRGEIRWCQGYTEPGAGSDLAGLQTRAEDKGDHYLVNGQKIWTSYAELRRLDLLPGAHRTRTRPSTTASRSCSFDMALAGRVGRADQADQRHVAVLPDLLRGREGPEEEPGRARSNGGWTIAKALLQHEREMIGGMGLGMGGSGGGGSLEQLAKEYVGADGGRIADPVLRDQVAQHLMDSRCFTTTVRRSGRRGEVGAGPGPGVVDVQALRHRDEQAPLRAAGEGARLAGASAGRATASSRASSRTTREWLRSKGNSIEGGTVGGAAQHHRQARARSSGLSSRGTRTCHSHCPKSRSC